jgi:hypothetical protein
MNRREIEGEIASITIDTAFAINKAGVELSTLVELRKATPWWRFGKRKKLKRSIAVASAVQAMAAVLGASQIYTSMSAPRPKYPSGI